MVRAGVAVLVANGESLLMLKRYGKHGSGTWSIPGGWMEYGESFFDTAAREVKEETSVDVEPVRVRHVTNDIFEDHGLHAVTIFVEARYASGEPTITEPDKCLSVCWMPLRQLHELTLFDPLRRWVIEDGFVPGFGQLGGVT